MSTYWGYVCQSHDPHLESERWFNHGEDVLTEAYQLERAGEWPNDPAWPLLDEPRDVKHRGYFTSAPIHWLREHPKCQVALRSEYGDTKSLDAPTNGGTSEA